MEKIITSRHSHIGDHTKQWITEHLEKIEREYKKLTSARVILDSQKTLHYAEVILHGKNINIDAKAEDPDLRVAVTHALDKAERQLQKFLSKIKDHHDNHKEILEVHAEEEGQ